MAAPSNPHEEEEEAWLLTYADMITLLMAFFVMLINFTKYDAPAMQEAVQGIKNEVNGTQGKEKSPANILKTEIQDIVYNVQADEVINVTTDDKGVVLELASSAFYRPGSAEFRDEALPVLSQIAQSILSEKYKNYLIEIEGHTDDDPISTAIYPSNWELSTGRATRVARFLIDKGMVPTRLKATGFAETRPKVPNRTAEGSPIKENQAQNRRVNIRVYPQSLEENKSRGAAPKGPRDLIETTDKTGAPTGGEAGKGTGRSTDSGIIKDVLKGLGVR